MALDIFSSFDDHYKVTKDFFLLMWLTMLFGVLFATRIKLFMESYMNFSTFLMMKTSKTLYKQSLLSKTGGSASIINGALMIILIMNLQGLLPYTFSLTSHLAINLSIALPLWLSIILMSGTYNLGSFLSHLQPMGAPALLSPFLCVIELVSSLVRPLTLTVRLTANLSTGHILVGLLGISFSSTFSIFILLIGMFYLSFEIAVCLVQSYIFTMLPNLYGDEHPQN